MSSSKARVTAIAVVAGMVIAGGIYLAISLLTSGDSAAKKADAEAWTAQWQRARACLIGADPYVTSGELAIEMREAFAEDITEVYKDCAVMLGDTRRPEGTSSSDKAKEQLWIDVGLALRKLENAVRMRLDGFTPKRRRAIAVALDGVDEQHARLSKAFGTAAPVGAGQTKTLPVVKSKALRWSKGRVSTTKGLRQVGDTWHASIQQGLKHRDRLFVISGPDKVVKHQRGLDPKRRGWRQRVVWGLVAVDIAKVDELLAKPGTAKADKAKVDKAKPNKPAPPADAGPDDIEPPTSALLLKLGDDHQLIVKTTAWPQAQFHLHKDDNHIVGWSVGNTLFIAETSDAGKTWQQTYTTAGIAWNIDHLGWNRVVVRTTSRTAAGYLSVDINATTRVWTPTVLSEARYTSATACYATGNTIWWLLESVRGATVVRDAGGSLRMVAEKQPLDQLLACTADTMIAARSASGGDPTGVSLCKAAGCKHTLNVRAVGERVGAALSAKGELVAATKNNRILSVWRGGKRAYYRVRSKATLHALARFGDAIYALLLSGQRVRIVKLPN